MSARLSRLVKPLSLSLAGLGVLLAAYLGWVVADTPPVQALQSAAQAEPSVILSADGQELGRVQQNLQDPVPLADVSPWVVRALIATEDHRFRDHGGVDWLRTLKALARTATGRIEGGSTITQQLARNLFPEEIGRSRTINRKIKEVVTAWRIERLYTKDQILEAYLNTVPFLYNAVGIEAAARTYFDKPASALNARESATLVGMLKGTHYFNPVQHPERAKARRNLVLDQMVKRGVLPRADHAALKDDPLSLRFKRLDAAEEPAPHFTAYVRKWLEDWAEQHGADLERDGLVIHTTLDARMQQAATEAVAQQTQALQQVADVEWSQAGLSVQSRALGDYARAARRLPPFEHFWRQRPALLKEALRKTEEYQALRKAGRADAAALAELGRDQDLVQRVRATKTRLEAGFVAINPATGAILAWVGSRDHGLEQYDHVAQAQRQPGSTFKPIVYAAALQQGIPVSKLYLDSPVSVSLDDGGTWRPTDMSGSTYLPMTMWEGLVYSKNTITTQVMQDAGLDNIAALARAMGITTSKLDKVPSMALGTSPVTLLEMTSVYATIADQGRYRAPYVVDRITDRQGRELARFAPPAPRQALSLTADNDLVDMMRGVVKQGTGSLMHARFVPGADLAGKTGTTQRNADGWFMVMHPQVVAGAWVGFNDQRVTMRGSYWGQGGHSALLLVGDFMQRAVKNKWVDAKTVFASPMLPPVTGPREWGSEPGEVIEGDGALPPSPEQAAPFDPSLDPGIEPLANDPASPPQGRLQARHEAALNQQELGEVMRAMGRDPDTGIPLTRSP